jgi:asparagine synthase (glutamine-hydrolysing)
MRRLSIIDVEGGHQPLSDATGRQWLVCNGEIYNFRELRAALQSKGHRFKSGSDCEVILHLYREYGEGFVEHLNGMYGFALWDSERRRFLLVRDRLGVKPLYYAISNGTLIFASEMKSILRMPGFTVSIDPVALDAYLSLGYTPGPLSLVSGIRKLPPASVLKVEAGALTISTYWKVPREIEQNPDIDALASSVRDSIERSVKSQMVSDVPIGAFLSGGIDSSAVVAFMARHTDTPVRTYSIGFEGNGAESFYNELPYARQVSDLFHTDHKEIIVTPDVVRLLPRLIWHLDEPIADSALVTTYLVSEFASRDVKVILSGVGGDELFGGYRRYLGEYYDAAYRRIPSWVRTGVLQKLAPYLPSDRHSKVLNTARLLRSFVLSAELPHQERYRRYVEVFGSSALKALLVRPTPQPFDAIGEAFEKTSSDDVLHQLMCVDLVTQLPDDLLVLTDKMTMATSLECRVPLLDHELVELASSIPASARIRNGQLKHVLKKALEGVLPGEVLHRGKRGFGAPVGAWMKRQLAPVVKQLLSKGTIEGRGLFRWETVRDTIAAHDSNRADHTDHLSALMNLEIWCRLFLDGESHEDVADALTEGAAIGNSVRVPSVPVST